MKERAKNREQEIYIERKQKAKMIGKAAWDKIFPGENFNIPPTRFMDKVKVAVSETDYQDIKKGIIDTLQDEKTTCVIVSTPHSQRLQTKSTLC